MHQQIIPQLVFTDSAAFKVAELIEEEQNPNFKLRVYITGGGCSGFQYGFTFDEQQNIDDIVISKTVFSEAKILSNPVNTLATKPAQLTSEDELKTATPAINNTQALEAAAEDEGGSGTQAFSNTKLSSNAANAFASSSAQLTDESELKTASPVIDNLQAFDADKKDEGSSGTVVTLLIDAMSYQYLVGGEIDYKDGLDGAQFIIRNPNAKTTCGCGSSFSV